MAEEKDKVSAPPVLINVQDTFITVRPGVTVSIRSKITRDSDPETFNKIIEEGKYSTIEEACSMKFAPFFLENPTDKHIEKEALRFGHSQQERVEQIAAAQQAEIERLDEEIKLAQAKRRALEIKKAKQAEERANFLERARSLSDEELTRENLQDVAMKVVEEELSARKKAKEQSDSKSSTSKAASEKAADEKAAEDAGDDKSSASKKRPSGRK